MTAITLNEHQRSTIEGREALSVTPDKAVERDEIVVTLSDEPRTPCPRSSTRSR